MTHLITGAVKKAVVPSRNLTATGPYLPGYLYNAAITIAAFKGPTARITVSSSGNSNTTVVKVIVKTGTFLSDVTNVGLQNLPKGTVKSITVSPAIGGKTKLSVKETVANLAGVVKLNIVTPFDLGNSALNLKNNTTFTFTLNKITAVPGDSLVFFSKKDTVSSGGFLWFDNAKTVLMGKVGGTNATGTITIPASTTYIAAGAFAGCKKLKGAVTIPNSVTDIGGGAFASCTGFTSLTLGSGIKQIGGGAFQMCTKLAGALTIPNSVTSIGSYAFQGCTGFNGNLTLGSGLKQIEQDAFSGCRFLRLIDNTKLPDVRSLLNGCTFTDE